MASSFTTEAFSLLSVGIVAIALRIIARTTSVGVRDLQFDDYLMCGAAVIYSLETATAYIVGAWWLGLANNGMTDEQRRTLDPHSHEYHLRVGGSKTQLVGWSLYTLLLWTLKLCMCHFYSRLTLGIYHLEIRVKIGYVLIAATYLATELSILLGCQPFSNNWQIYPDPGNHCQPAISKIDLYVTVVLNVLTDAYLMSIPLPMLWRANLEIKRKLSLILIFGGGVFVMMAGILRCALVIKDPIHGAQAAGSWACRETFVAVIIGNAPMIYPLFRRGVERVYHYSSSSRFSGRPYGDNGPASSSNGGGGNSLPLKSSLSKPARRGKLRSVNALPTTFHDDDYGDDVEQGAEEGWDSKQRIVVVGSREIVDGDGEGGRNGSVASSSVMDAVVVGGTVVVERGGEEAEGGQAVGRQFDSMKDGATGRGRSDSDALGGIRVTKEATVRSEERVNCDGGGDIGGLTTMIYGAGEVAVRQGTRSPSPPHATYDGSSITIVHSNMQVNKTAEVIGTSGNRFDYRGAEGLEYTAHV
ncbi:hypothetical protein DBV05_g4570 [Lasiodiplodia theobromae]|uniref:Rhodopsin domain-containing protein n=1 Tax=Lasiodiplodia theobromae TaxID=45133 RepID=A0A5N5DGV6_9PEZI|nr:hypothetical protein DBV05_g4570 [Lasiodiplodia theobromae]